MAQSGRIDAVLWDIGGVLLDWNPRYLYRKMFDDEAEMERFLTDVCTPDWHSAHDRGVSFEESCALLARRHPEHAGAIMAWGRHSEEMEGGEIAETVAILTDLRAAGVPCYALTNMERETYPRRVARYPFMSWFEDTVVSSHEGLVKPDPRLYQVALQRFGLNPERVLAIDDLERNLATAASLGMTTIHYRSPKDLRARLTELGMLERSQA